MHRPIQETLTRLESFMAGVDDALALPREAAEWVYSLVLARGAKRAVEIGTSYGYSGVWIAAALEFTGGTLITLDREARKSEAARANFKSAGLIHRVELGTGAAADILPSLTGPFDFVLNDADKENCIRYVELLLPKLATRAVVLTDNTATHPEALAPYMTWMRGRSDFHTVNVPIGNGMDLSVKIG